MNVQDMHLSDRRDNSTRIGNRIVLAILAGFVSRYRFAFALTLFLSLFTVLFELAKPWPVKVVVDYALDAQDSPKQLQSLQRLLPGAESDYGLIAWAVFAALLIAIAGGVFSYLALNASVSLGKNLVVDLSVDLFSKLQRLSLEFHASQTTGDLLQRTSQDVFVVYFLVANVVIPGIVSTVALVGIFAILVQLDLTMALCTASVIPLLIASLAVFQKPMDRSTSRQYASQAEVMSLIEQSLTSMRVIQAFSRESYIRTKVQHRARNMGEAYSTAIRIGAGFNLVNSVITGAAAAVLLGLGAFRVKDGTLTLGELLVFLAYLAALYGPVNQLTMAAGYSVQVSARGKRVVEVLLSGDEISEPKHPQPLNAVEGEVVFESVGFNYRGTGNKFDGVPTLRNINFTARPQEVVAIVGHTGAGKTTLVALMSRFFDPTEGSIRLDGVDIRDLQLRTLREQVSLVLQEPFLFPMSISENIAFGNPDAQQCDIENAAVLARAHSFISRLPDGYDTILDERGGNLSGGERQRIAIARALLKKSPILILDEPTSALDARTEAELFSGLRALMTDRTVFVISHRLRTVRDADQILVLDAGTIVDCGTHEELSGRSTYYQRLFRIESSEHSRNSNSQGATIE